jgi:hypothetical protein
MSFLVKFKYPDTPDETRLDPGYRRGDELIGASLSSRSPGRPKNDLAPTGGGSDGFSDPGAQLTCQVAESRNTFAVRSAAAKLSIYPLAG